MPLDTYAGLQTSILDWLARPGDTLMMPALPDIIVLFESEARQRLRTAGAEAFSDLYANAGVPDLALPDDFVELRSISMNGSGPLGHISAQQAATMPTAGMPLYYTVHGGGDYDCQAGGGGAVLRLTPPPDGAYVIQINYLRGLPALSDAAPSNWLLKTMPSLYLFGCLVEASVFIKQDERALGWLQRREAAFETLETADRKTRWGGPLTIRPDMVTP